MRKKKKENGKRRLNTLFVIEHAQQILQAVRCIRTLLVKDTQLKIEQFYQIKNRLEQSTQ